MAEISPLRRRMIEDMTVRNLSPATQQSYLNAVSKFSRYFGRSPDRLSLEDVHAFQVHLVATGISWPALNQIVCALRFFYGVTLGQAIVPERIAYAREPSKLPVVLSADEVVRFLEAIPSLKSRTALTTVYAAGLRVSEVVLLKVVDIDSQRMLIRVEHGKGGKDRYVMLSPQLLRILEVTVAVVLAIQPKLLQAEIALAARRRPESLTAYDLYLRAMPQFYLATREGLAEAIRLARRALELDPRFGLVAALAGVCHMQNALWGYAIDRQFEREEAVRL